MNYNDAREILDRKNITMTVDFSAKKFCLKQGVGKSFIFMPLVDEFGNEFAYMYFKDAEELEEKLIAQVELIQEQDETFDWAGIQDLTDDYKERYGDHGSRMGVEL